MITNKLNNRTGFCQSLLMPCSPHSYVVFCAVVFTVAFGFSVLNEGLSGDRLHKISVWIKKDVGDFLKKATDGR